MTIRFPHPLVLLLGAVVVLAAKVPFEQWLKFALVGAGLTVVVGIIGVLVS